MKKIGKFIWDNRNGISQVVSLLFWVYTTVHPGMSFKAWLHSDHAKKIAKEGVRYFTGIKL